MKIRKTSRYLVAKVASAIVVLVCVATIARTFAPEPNQDKPGGASAPATRQPAMSRPTTLVGVATPTLSKDQAAAALSDYLGRVQLILRHLSILHDIYMSGLQQAVQSKNREQIKKKAKSMRAASERARDALFAIPIPEELTEQDADQFEDLQNAALELAIAILEMDFALDTRTGINRVPDLTKQIAGVKKARREFESQKMRSLRYLRFSPEKINRHTLMVKQTGLRRSPTLEA